MEQLSLFDHSEKLKKRAINALVEFRITEAGQAIREMHQYEPDWHLLKAAQTIHSFWRDHFPGEDSYVHNEPARMFKLWLKFNDFGDEKWCSSSPFYPKMRRFYYVTYLGLEAITAELRIELRGAGTTPLELLVELEEWKRALAELTEMERDKSFDMSSTRFCLISSRVHYHNGNIFTSRDILLNLIFRSPGTLEVEDVVDHELLDHLDDIRYLASSRKTSIELLPYIGLMRGSFAEPSDPESLLMKLEQKAELQGFEAENVDRDRVRYWLFSVQSWRAHLSQRLGLEFTGFRKKMKQLEPDLFEHYRDELKRCDQISHP